MSKIQISTIEKTANVQVIELDAKFVAAVVRLQQRVRNGLFEKHIIGSPWESLHEDVDEFFTDMTNALLEENEPSFKAMSEEDAHESTNVPV